VAAVAPKVGRDAFERTKLKAVQDIEAAMTRYREHQSRRLSLPPLPEFPSESELQQARLQWLKDQQAAQQNWQVSRLFASRSL
jgi:hypothetical protein